MSLLITLALFWGCSSQTIVPTDNKTALMSSLTLNYDKEQIPVLSQTPVQLNITYYLRSVLSLDDRNEVLTTNAYFAISWCDYRLIWDTSHFVNITHTFLPRSDVWIPDLTLANTATEYQVLGREDDIVRVRFDGCVLWIPGNIHRTRCEVDITYYPFDQQVCSIEVDSWIYRNDEIQIHSLSVNSLPEKWNLHGEWNVANISAGPIRNEFSSGLEISILLKRRYTFYIFSVIVPLTVTSLLNLLAFILRTDTGEKITLTSTTFISYFVFLSYISDNIPNTSKNIAILGVFISVQLGICAISVFLSVYIRKPPREK